MKILPSISPPNKLSVAKSDIDHAVTIGNFDGCHLGHQALIRETLRLKAAAPMPLQALALSFSPRPTAFFKGLEHERLLFSPQQKLRALAELGLDAVCLQNFGLAFSQLSPLSFYQDYLQTYLRAKAVVIGENFYFGHQRQGSPLWLKRQMEADGLKAELCSAVTYQGEAISSTRIRRGLEDGDIVAVNAMLGRPYLLEGVSRRGDQLGRKLGFPTLNLEESCQLYPQKGVYAGYVWFAGLDRQKAPSLMQRPASSLPAVINIGIRPTFAALGASLKAEAHVLVPFAHGDGLYNQPLAFYFLAFLRSEQKFPTREQLCAQIQRDCEQARHDLS